MLQYCKISLFSFFLNFYQDNFKIQRQFEISIAFDITSSMKSDLLYININRKSAPLQWNQLRNVVKIYASVRWILYHFTNNLKIHSNLILTVASLLIRTVGRAKYFIKIWIMSRILSCRYLRIYKVDCLLFLAPARPIFNPYTTSPKIK